MKLTELLKVLEERQYVCIYDIKTERDVYIGSVEYFDLEKDYEVVLVANGYRDEMAIDVKENNKWEL